MFNLKLHKDKRNRGICHQKGRFGQSKTRKQAIEDIMEVCGHDRFYVKNFLNNEHMILEYTKENYNDTRIIENNFVS